METVQRAVEKMRGGYNCAQSVLFAVADRVGLSADQALKLSTGFGAGLGRCQETCGAVSGAVLALGLRYGRGEADDRSQQEVAYTQVREFVTRFEARHRSVRCLDLLDGCRLLTAEGAAIFKSADLINRCHQYVATSTEILIDLMGR